MSALPEASRRWRVLLLEDDAFIAMEMEALVEEAGAEVVGPFAAAAAALAALEAATPDAAVLDVTVRDGRSGPVARALRERGVPYLVATGYVPRQIEEPELATAPLLPKPVDRERLLALLGGILRGR